ncbi:MAG: NAD(P)/FAD-dependent oxidoreductase [Sphingomicrobium sp.]
MDQVECIVVGAGAVGLAIARALAIAGHEVVIVEGERHIGSATSSRNSEVIHAGIYYPPGSLKARLCVAGRKRLYDHVERTHVPYRRCGKLIVATSDEELATLERIRDAAHASGVDDLAYVSKAHLRERFPELACVAALASPSTGIVDSHQLMLSLLGDAQEAGAMLALDTSVAAATITREGEFIVHFDGASRPIRARRLINSAGLGASALAARIDGLDPAHIPETILAKGNYFALSGRSPFDCLIYPVPTGGGLGTHLTLDLAGQARFGPDVEWVDQIDYEVDPSRANAFTTDIRRYWPGLPDGALQPAYAGIRPKLTRSGEPIADFRIDGLERHGITGLVNLFGIESPGLTASLAIADHVTELLA